MRATYEVPREVNGWVRTEHPRRVTAANIFDYMDGAGELYLAYAFVGLDVWKFTRAEAPEILVEIYEMGNSADAFGVLSFDLGGEEVGVGQKSVYGAGLLRFWQGRHFARILAEAETPEAKAALLDIGKSVASDLPGGGTLPELVVRLPEAGLLPESVHYFHRKMCLDYFYYLADDNILNLNKETNAVIADYRTASGKAKLLAVEYDPGDSCAEASRSFHAVYLKQWPPGDGAIRSNEIEGAQWVSSLRNANLLLIVFEGESQKDCEELLQAAVSSLTQGGKGL
ncbi:MAG: hypothetical protein Q8Q12_19625 [bacterium]|nr:hypothetical protein [bacterium]